MKTNEEMSSLARAFYDAYFECMEEADPGRSEVLQSQFHAVHSVAAAFMGALIDSFYHEPPWTRFFFFTGIALKSLALGAMGLFPGVWTRSEAVQGWNSCQKVLVNAGAFFKEEESAGSS